MRSNGHSLWGRLSNDFFSSDYSGSFIFHIPVIVWISNFHNSASCRVIATMRIDYAVVSQLFRPRKQNVIFNSLWGQLRMLHALWYSTISRVDRSRRKSRPHFFHAGLILKNVARWAGRNEGSIDKPQLVCVLYTQRSRVIDETSRRRRRLRAIPFSRYCFFRRLSYC